MIELKDTENRQAVYVYRCKNSTISIPAKVTAITLDSCENGKDLEFLNLLTKNCRFTI